MEIFTATMGMLQLCHAGYLPPSIFPMLHVASGRTTGVWREEDDKYAPG